jgi:hypothetical protein
VGGGGSKKSSFKIWIEDENSLVDKTLQSWLI